MAGSVHNIDFGIFVHDRSVFGENGDAAFPFDVVGVHDTFGHGLPFPEYTALFQQFIHQRGFAMIYMGNNGNISDIFSFLPHNNLISVS